MSSGADAYNLALPYFNFFHQLVLEAAAGIKTIHEITRNKANLRVGSRVFVDRTFSSKPILKPGATLRSLISWAIGKVVECRSLPECVEPAT